jgi:high-affinity iron transporter
VKRIHVLQWIGLIWGLTGLCGHSEGAYADFDYPSEIRQLMQLAEYIGVDYTEAVSNGEVVNQQEYLAMVELAQLIVDKSALISKLSRERMVSEQARTLQTAIGNKHPLHTVQKFTVAYHKTLLKLIPQVSLPGALLTQSQTQVLFEQSCAGCHGESGQGNGLLAVKLSPTPTDFTDKHRAVNRSVLGLYDAIANGISGTSMAGFDSLSEQQKWSLAFYVGSLAFQSTSKMAEDVIAEVSLSQLVNYSPKILSADMPIGLRIQVEQLRGHPQPLFVEVDKAFTWQSVWIKIARSLNIQ